MADRDGQGREALAAVLYEADRARHEPPWGDALDHHREPFRHMAHRALASDWLKAHDAEVAAATAVRIALTILDGCDDIAVQPCRTCRHAARVVRGDAS